MCFLYVLVGYPSWGQEKAATAHVRIEKGMAPKTEKSTAATSDASGVVAWLVPLDRSTAGNPPEKSAARLQIVQKNKSFQPHLTVTRVGSVVDFPNHDPYFHNVFSLFDGKRFDLGLYEAGATNSVRFDHAGISFLFCNIHPEMSAVIVAVDTPYYAVSTKSGSLTVPGVPNGEYELHVWYERSLPEKLKNLARRVQLSDQSRDLGTIVVPEDSNLSPAHKNKYGQDYPPPPKQPYSNP